MYFVRDKTAFLKNYPCGVTSTMLATAPSYSNPDWISELNLSALGNLQRAQLKVVPHLKSLLVSLPSNQVLLDPDYYCWQTSPKASLLLSVGRRDHRLKLSISESAINNKTPTQKNPACVISGALQNENKSSVPSAMDAPVKGQTGTCCWMVSFRFLLLRKVSFKRDLHLFWVVAFRKYSRSKTA